MSYSTFITFWCDWPECYARCETSYTKITEARVYAAKHGWSSRFGMDFCGRPDQAEPYTHQGDTWHGCAERTDHVPAVAFHSKGEVKLSCSCGWVPQPRWGWEIVGVTSRTSVEFRWAEHVKEATKTQ